MIEDKGHQETPKSRVANKNWRDHYDDIFKKNEDPDDLKDAKEKPE